MFTVKNKTIMKEQETSSSHIKAILTENQIPLLIRKKDLRKHWPCATWSMEKWTSVFSGTKLPFRVHTRKLEMSNKWENDPEALFEATFEQFLEWQREEESGSLPDSNPFAEFAHSEHWAYSSYNHISQLFEEEKHKELFESINWKAFGLKSDLELSAKDSTLWIGSEGSFTPCHQDSYGYNVVMQLAGR